MKKTLFVVFCTILSFNVFSQIELGIKTGLSSLDLVSEGIFIKDDQNVDYKLNFKDAEYGFHFGLYSRLSFLGVYIEPAALLNSSKDELTELGEEGVFTTIKNEQFTSLDIPVLIGMKLAFLRIQAGPVAHIILDSTSDLIDISGYNERLEEARYGFQAGFGVDLWKLRLDFLYEGNLSKFGDHIAVGGNNYAFDESPARLIGHVAYRF